MFTIHCMNWLSDIIPPWKHSTAACHECKITWGTEYSAELHMNEKIPGKLRDLQQDSVFMSLRKMSQIIHETERGRTDMRSQSSKNCLILVGKNQDNNINFTFSFTLYLSQNSRNMWSFVCIIQLSKDDRILKHQSMQFLFIYFYEANAFRGKVNH